MGVLLLFVGASGVFLQLEEAMNVIWSSPSTIEVKPCSGSDIQEGAFDDGANPSGIHPSGSDVRRIAKLTPSTPW